MARSDTPGATSSPVAIVGVACRLPGAAGPDAFADLLASGQDAVTEVPAGRWTHARFLHPEPGSPGRGVHFRAGVLDADPLRFDAAGFGISPREAAEMDPQQRLLLQLAREALRDAGWPEERAAGTRTGVWIGASTTDWSDLRQHDPAGGDRHVMTGGALSILANRLTNAFDLRGPAMVLDTACSSGLVALDAACAALARGEAEAALVGGVNLLLSPFPFGGFFRAGMLSARGRCQAFGAGADGYVRAEGGVVLALKPLARAMAEGCAVRGVILATGVNAAGRTNGLSLPDRAAQARLIAEVLARSGVTPDDLAAFEAHGTGTPVGDPIEAAAIAEAIGQRRSRPLPLGSAKSNIGHAEAASGLVGVLKALLMLGRGRVFPTLHADEPNPHIPFRDHGLALARRPARLVGRAVGVNSFGFGGTNACAVIGAVIGVAPPARREAAASRSMPPLLLSARDTAQLRAEAQGWRALLAAASPARDAAARRGQARRRDLLPERLVLRGGAAEVAGELDRFLAGDETLPGRGTAAPGLAGVAFVFAGNGAPWPGMGRAELRDPAFRDAVAEADAALRPQLGGRSVLAMLRRGVSAEELARTDLAQPALFAVQWGIVGALAARGIRPALVVGHSVGEVAAAACAGLLPLAAAARLVAERSRHQHATRGQGRMAALSGLPEPDARDLLARLAAPGEMPLEIAAINGPAQLTVAGPEAALDRLAAEAAARKLAFLPLSGIDYAFHSAAMEPVRAPLLEGLRGLRGRAFGLARGRASGLARGRMPMFSTVTGAALERADMTPLYWWRNLREPVRFDLAVRAAAALRPALFLEIGPHPVLQGYLRANLREAGSPAPVAATLRRREDGAGHRDPFGDIADRATALGADPRGAAVFDGPAEWRALPSAPPPGEPHRLPPSAEAVWHVDPPRDHPLLGFRTVALTGDEPREWTRTLDVREEPWLADHALRGTPVLPASAMAEMALAAGFLAHPRAAAVEVAELAIFRPLPLDAPRQSRARLDAATGHFTLESRARLADEPWESHAAARVAALPVMPAAGEAERPSGASTAGAAITARAAAMGLDYGPAFRAVLVVRAQAACAEAELHRPDAAPEDAGFHLHPSRFDGALQALLALLGEASGADLHLPVRFGRIVVRRHAAPAARADLVLREAGERTSEADIVLRDAAGAAVAVVARATLQRVPPEERDDGGALAFRTEWVPAPPPAGWPEPPPTLPLAALDLQTVAAPLPERLAEAGLLAEASLAAALRDAPGTAPGLRALAEGFGELPSAATLWRQAWSEAPELAADLAAVAALGEGGEGGAEAPGAAGAAGAAALLLGGAVARHLAECLAAAAAELATGWPAARPLRLAALGPAAALIAEALRRRTLPPQADIAEAADAAEPSFEADIVVGLGLRAPIQALAAALRRATAPGGALLLGQPAPGLLWSAVNADAVAASAVGANAVGRGAAGPGDWLAALADAGWEGPRAAPLSAAPWAATVLVAGAPRGARLLAAAPARRFALVAAAPARALAEALAEALGASGAQVARHALGTEPAPRGLRGATLVALPAAPEDLALLARLAAAAEGSAARLAVAVTGEGPAAEAALALGRALANEHPSLRPLRLCVPAGDPARSARLLAAALLEEGSAEAEQRLSPQGRCVPRHLPGLPDRAPPGPRRLEVARPGRLSTLRWSVFDLPEPGPGEVLVRVEACGLNFRDVMWAQGLLPEEALRPGFAGPGLGMEIAGTVLAGGAGAGFAEGQRVFGVAPRALATRALTRAEALAPIPDGVPAEAAAALPVAFLTALYALEECARVAPGERVLIHGGAGAVGLAAIQVALAAGARVAASAATPERRALLRALGCEAALDSRCLGFADALRARWPDGADVVLNSLSGEAMERSLGLVAPFGRFVELGKRDFAENRAAPLRPLRRNATYFAVDVDELARARPAIAARMLRDVAARLAEGRIRPLPLAAHRAEAAEDAFRALQRGGHIGKRVILPPAEASATAPAWMPAAGRPVVVVGGVGGFGLEAACWLAERGARRIALLSRRGPDAPGAEQARARLATIGAEVLVLAADAAEEAALAAALAHIRARWGEPVGGVVHAAAVFADGVAARLPAQAWGAAWRAKPVAAELLDRLTRADAPSLFLLFSSATVPMGAPGQAAYVAANAGLEAVARRRHEAGLPALAVQWGPVADAGALAAGGAEALSQRLGAEALPARTLLDALPALLESGLPVAGAARLRPGRAMALPVLAEPALAALAPRAGADVTEDDAARLRARVAASESPQAALALLRDAVAGEVARILRLGEVPPAVPLARLGLDSLGGIELRSALERRLAVGLPLAAVNDDITVESLSRRLHERIVSQRQPVAAAQPDAAAQPVAAAQPETAARWVAAAHPETAARWVAAAQPETAARRVAAAHPETAARRVAAARPDAAARPGAAARPDAAAHPETAPRQVAAAQPEAAAQREAAE